MDSNVSRGAGVMMVRIRPMSRQEVRALDQRAATELAMPTLLLMENAGRGAASWLAELAGAIPPDAGGRPFTPSETMTEPEVPHGPKPPRMLILCGPGNNGGDGGVVARHLDAWGFPVRVAWFARADALRGDAAVQHAILARSGIDQTTWFDDYPGDEVDPGALHALLAGADWLVDALLGTGLSRPVDGPLRTVIEAINDSGRPAFALDLPSGLDADTGKPLGVAVHAQATATFVAPKRGFSEPGAVDYTGDVAVIDIGLPRSLIAPYVVGG